MQVAALGSRSLMLKMNKLILELALYDIAGTAGVAADLSHCNAVR
jgi:malate dehydrogenase